MGGLRRGAKRELQMDGSQGLGRPTFLGPGIRRGRDIRDFISGTHTAPQSLCPRMVLTLDTELQPPKRWWERLFSAHAGRGSGPDS